MKAITPTHQKYPDYKSVTFFGRLEVVAIQKYTAGEELLKFLGRLAVSQRVSTSRERKSRAAEASDQKAKPRQTNSYLCLPFTSQFQLDLGALFTAALAQRDKTMCAGGPFATMLQSK